MCLSRLKRILDSRKVFATSSATHHGKRDWKKQQLLARPSNTGHKSSRFQEWSCGKHCHASKFEGHPQHTDFDFGGFATLTKCLAHICIVASNTSMPRRNWHSDTTLSMFASCPLRRCSSLRSSQVRHSIQVSRSRTSDRGPYR